MFHIHRKSGLMHLSVKKSHTQHSLCIRILIVFNNTITYASSLFGIFPDFGEKQEITEEEDICISSAISLCEYERSLKSYLPCLIIQQVVGWLYTENCFQGLQRKKFDQEIVLQKQVLISFFFQTSMILLFVTLEGGLNFQ